jgi:hypothetical protein
MREPKVYVCVDDKEHIEHVRTKGITVMIRKSGTAAGLTLLVLLTGCSSDEPAASAPSAGSIDGAACRQTVAEVSGAGAGDWTNMTMVPTLTTDGSPQAINGTAQFLPNDFAPDAPITSMPVTFTCVYGTGTTGTLHVVKVTGTVNGKPFAWTSPS